MEKRYIILLVSILLISIFSFESASARESINELDKCIGGCKADFTDEADRRPCIQECKEQYGDQIDELSCLPCGDACAPYDFVVVAECLPPTREFDCGYEDGECVVKEKEDYIFEGYEDSELEVDAGTTPDSALYVFDKFFDRFGDDIEVREEKIAEIKAMVEAGDIESAKKALMIYIETAEEFEKEVGPERREEALRSSAAIRNAMRDIQDKVPPGERDEFVHDIIDREHSIATAAEIASKINELCRELSDLDPELFYQNCRVDDEGPRWHKEMFDDLTEEQKKEAKKFAEIMGQCFETSGQECRCDEIPYSSFANACSRAAPLATACDIEGDEKACEKLDSLDMPELPPHLEEVMRFLEGDIQHKKFDLHMPPECVEAGATTPEDCSKIMITTHAPEECKEALLAANPRTEMEGREICDKIMYELHAPPECIERGITDDEECKDFMWGIGNRPSECQANQIHDFRDCEEFLRRGRDKDPKMGGPRFDFNCREIEDPMERLDCYDNAGSQVGGYHGVSDGDYVGPCMTEQDWEVKKQGCRDLYGQHAGDEPIMGDSGEGHQCPIDLRCIDFGQYEEQQDGPDEWQDDWDDWSEGDDDTWSECQDGCMDECPGSSGTDCIDDHCVCYYEDDSSGEGESEGEGEAESEGEGEAESEGEGEAESEGGEE